jgi:superfamily I DNA and/or RNA helicase
MHPLLPKFIHSFQKAIKAEMKAMRQRLGPFEVPLANGRVLDADDSDQGRMYVFKVLQPNDKLVLQAECTLRYETSEALVTITGIDQDEVTIRCERKIGLNYDSYTLVIYPWFLYERLILALESLLDSPDHFISNALMVFGKISPQHQPQPLHAEHPELNASQQQAVQLCSDSNLAFVWGPPGTGKTFTLGHIVTELLRQGKRILITSTTNAAVDQALAKLASLDDAQKPFKQGQIVRIGQTNAETFGASLPRVLKRLNAETEERVKYLKRRRQAAKRQIEQCTLILDKLATSTQSQQLNLFGEVQSEAITETDLRSVFSAKLAQHILNLPATQQKEAVTRRQKRLETLIDLCQKKIKQLAEELRRQEVAVVQKARVILATMTNMYISTLLAEERFDVVIIEEAGMAILPTLFYCATLAREKVIMVGDPKQLPPIVQSRDEYVYRAMGRNIFEVTVPNPYTCNTVVMLDTQYRMHQVIGNLVSNLFYDGKLRHGENTVEREQIARKKPYPGAPLVVMDTENQTTCTTREGSYSRFNEKTAQTCVDLAIQAVRGGIEFVAIITPYVAQSRLIRQLLSDFQQEAQHVTCQTIHRFQGGERDLVILDTVDTSPLSPGILLADHSPNSSAQNLINVSISRARGKLIIISDVSYFHINSPNSIIDKMLQQAIQAGLRVSL